MTLLYDYYRPHSATLVADERDGEWATREPIVPGTGRMLPVHPCIVLDARGQDGNPATQIAFREGLTGPRADDYIAAIDLNKYGSDVVRSMWTEIVDLRGQLRHLETANRQHKQLRNNDTDDEESRMRKFDDRLEFGEKYVMLKQKLSKQAVDIMEYRDKIIQLQEELNKKGLNEVKKPEHRSNPAGSSSDPALQLKLRDKENRVRDLEMTCKKQEQVIEQLEKLLEKRNNDLYEKRTHDMLSMENRKLKSRLQQMTDEEEEKIRLQEDLKERKRGEIREERIRTLEKQILDNARRWSQERTDLVMRLQESEFGLRSHPLRGTFENLPPNFDSSGRGNFENQSKAKSTTSRNQGLPSIYR